MDKKEEEKLNQEKVRPFKKVTRTVSTVILILSTILCFVVVVKTVIHKEAGLFGFRFFYVITGSMEPTLPVGSLLLVGESDTYEKDDIITFYSQDESIKGQANTHRIVQITQEDGQVVYITQGDANNVPDTIPVKQDEVIGKMYICINASFLKSLVEVIGTPMGFFVLILLPILGVAVSCMRNFKKAVEEEMHRSAMEALTSQEECLKDEAERKDTTE